MYVCVVYILQFIYLHHISYWLAAGVASKSPDNKIIVRNKKIINKIVSNFIVRKYILNGPFYGNRVYTS